MSPFTNIDHFDHWLLNSFPNRFTDHPLSKPKQSPTKLHYRFRFNDVIYYTFCMSHLFTSVLRTNPQMFTPESCRTTNSILNIAPNTHTYGYAYGTDSGATRRPRVPFPKRTSEDQRSLGVCKRKWGQKLKAKADRQGDGVSCVTAAALALYHRLKNCAGTSG